MAEPRLGARRWLLLPLAVLLGLSAALAFVGVAAAVNPPTGSLGGTGVTPPGPVPTTGGVLPTQGTMPTGPGTMPTNPTIPTNPGTMPTNPEGGGEQPEVPEIDPATAAGALTLLVGGLFLLTDRHLRKSTPR